MQKLDWFMIILLFCNLMFTFCQEGTTERNKISKTETVNGTAAGEETPLWQLCLDYRSVQTLEIHLHVWGQTFQVGWWLREVPVKEIILTKRLCARLHLVLQWSKCFTEKGNS